MNLIDEIKSKVTIIELINRLGIEINSAGFINSIYKNEKTPSLKIYPKSESYFCYSTNKGGDVIDFYADYYHLDKSTAIKELADTYNITCKNNGGTAVVSHILPEVKPKQPKYSLLNDIEFEQFNERAGIIEYHGNQNRQIAERLAFDYILQNRRGIQTKIYTEFYKYCTAKGIDESAFNYLTGDQRGLIANTINRFKLFSIHNVKESIEFLKDTFSRYELLISGFFSRKYFVFAKHRIIIPYIENGQIVYLRGRYFLNGNPTPKKFGKYIGLNNLSLTLSPKRFYNADLLNTLNPLSDLIICEGEFDCMIATQHRSNSLAIAGTSNFPTEKIHLLKPYNIHLLFDNDAAGKKATEKIGREISEYGLSYKTIKLNNYKDITEMYCDKKDNKENGLIKK